MHAIVMIAAMAALPALAQEPALTPAPRMDQVWNQGAGEGSSKLRTASAGWYDTSDREAVRQAYRTELAATRTERPQWTGSAASCVAGQTSQAWRDTVARRINWFRAMAGVPAGVTLDGGLNTRNQRAALMFSANREITHDPPSSWNCYTEAGAEAAASSNVCLVWGNIDDPGCIELYIRDAGVGNSAAGHRRWFFSPSSMVMGTGDTVTVGTYPGGNPTANAIWVLPTGPAGPRPATRSEFVAWPPPGYVPYQTVYPRWSISIPDADFQQARVSMTRDGQPVSVRLEAVEAGYADETLVWAPDGMSIEYGSSWPRPGQDSTLTVVVSNVLIDGVPREYRYSVTVFDPEFASEPVAPAVPSLTGPGADPVLSPVTLNWSSDRAATYELYFGNTSPPPYFSTFSATSYTTGTLSPGTVFYWRVIARNSAGATSSPVASFTTVAAPRAPESPLPADGVSGVPVSVKLGWGPASGATAYEVYFGTSPTSMLTATVTATGFDPGPLSPGTKYYWRVQARGPSGSSSSPIWSFVTGALAGEPAGPNPANGSVQVSRSTLLQWVAPAGAESYDVYFGTAADPPMAASVQSAAYNPGELALATTYYWRVAAKSAGGVTQSARWSFTTGSPPAAPVLTSASPSLLSWSAAAGADSYDVHLGTSADPPQVARVTGQSYAPTGLAAGVTYRWRVAARNAFGTAPSSVGVFAIPAAAVVSPNPVDRASGVPLEIALRWSGASSGYDVYFGSSNNPPLVTGVTSSTYSPGRLQPGTTYYWRVVSREGAASPLWSFTTEQFIGPVSVRLPSPRLTAPSAGEVLVTQGVTLRWEPVAGAGAYHIRVTTALAAVVFTGSLLGGSSTSMLAELPPGALTLAVRACETLEAATCGDPSSTSFRVEPAAPGGVPAILSPAGGSTLRATTNLIAWSAVAGASAYEVELTDLATGRVELRIRESGLSTVFSMPGSPSYSLRVRACAAGCGPWTGAVRFAVDLPAPPTAAPAIRSSAISGNELSLTWTPVAGAAFYDVLVIQPPPAGPGGGALTVASKRVESTAVRLAMPGGSATAIVAAANGNGAGPFSAGLPVQHSARNPDAPVIGSPVAGSSVQGPVVLFTWSRVPGDDGANTMYRLYVQDLSRQAPAVNILTRASYHAVYLNGEGARYDAQVIANPGLAAERAGPAAGFVVRGTSAMAPTLVEPMLGTTVDAGNVQVSWTPVPGATLYEYYVSSSTGSQSRGVTAGRTIRTPLERPSALTPYSAAVRACPAGVTCVAGTDAGWGPWSQAAGSGVTSFLVRP